MIYILASGTQSFVFCGAILVFSLHKQIRTDTDFYFEKFSSLYWNNCTSIASVKEKKIIDKGLIK